MTMERGSGVDMRVSSGGGLGRQCHSLGSLSFWHSRASGEKVSRSSTVYTQLVHDALLAFFW